MVEDVQEDQMTAQPAHVINHPAWTLGHLTVSCQMICEDLNISPWLPDEWFEMFMKQPAIADPSAYPAKEHIIAVLEDARHRLIEHVKNHTDESLTAPFPQVLCSEMFPTLGHALNYGMNVHTSF
ncbi:DinB family protein, partial [bacterium]|nr:DinB family protein [bacterium]